MIVVTGGAGFIGSNIVAGLQDHGLDDLAVIDNFGMCEKWRNLSRRTLRYLVSAAEGFEFIRQHEKEVDVVIHMGAISSTTEADVDAVVRNNFTLTMSLWRFCAERGIRFIYASSAATYGAGENEFCDDDSLGYLNRLCPLNAYGWSKVMVDRAIAQEKKNGAKCPPQSVGLKFFNVYGPNEYHKGGQKSVVAHIFPDALAGRPTQLFKSYCAGYEDGGQLRDFVWVGDVVSVVLWLLEHSDVSGLFNVGSGEAKSFNLLAGVVWMTLNKQINIQYKEMPESLREKYQYFTQADLTKLRKAGYITPMTSLEDGVKEYVGKYLMNTKNPYR